MAHTPCPFHAPCSCQTSLAARAERARQQLSTGWIGRDKKALYRALYTPRAWRGVAVNGWGIETDWSDENE